MCKSKLFSMFALLTLLLSAGMSSAVAQKPSSNAQALESLARVPEVALGQRQSDIDQITEQLSKLEPYIQYVSREDKFQVFDAEAALEDGFSKEVVLLAQEMVAYQNELAKAAASKGVEDITQLNVTTEEYPRLTKFFQLASQQVEARKAPGAVSPMQQNCPACGNWDCPVPDYSPPRYGYSSSDPEQTLLNWGFHHTANYACGGGYSPGSCAEDYTRGRDYYGPYGHCSGIRFRDHGRVTGSTSFNIQYGEPNPEVFSYWWPYWNWGAYVRWWHSNF